MRNKLKKLIALYYALFIVSSCCYNDFLTVSFRGAKVDQSHTLNHGSFTIFGIVEEENSGLKTGHIASLLNFSKLYASGCGGTNHYLYENYISDIEITCNEIIDDSIPTGDLINGYFDIQLFEESTTTHLPSKEKIYSLGNVNYVKNLKDDQTVDLYLKYTFSDGLIVLDTLLNQTLFD